MPGTATRSSLDVSAAEAFAARMLETINHAALALMTSLGHRTGLFDAMAALPPSTSAEIASESGLDERYVREWLGAMVTGRFVEHDAAAGTYDLPAEHAVCLTRAASPDNLACTAQWIAVLGGVEDDVVDCFREGGGVPYERFRRFHDVMAEESAQTVVSSLTGAILPLVPGLVNRLRDGIDVLDVGCGSGRALNHLARTFPRSRFVGYDISDDALGRARSEARTRGASNVQFRHVDAAAIEDVGAFDLITAFDAIHDQARPAAALKCVRRALRPDGVFLMQDIDAASDVAGNVDHPLGPFLYAISTMHCMSVSLAQGGAGLGTCWGNNLACRMLTEAGFTDVDVRRLEHDIQNAYYVAR